MTIHISLNNFSREELRLLITFCCDNKLKLRVHDENSDYLRTEYRTGDYVVSVVRVKYVEEEERCCTLFSTSKPKKERKLSLILFVQLEGKSVVPAFMWSGDYTGPFPPNMLQVEDAAIVSGEVITNVKE